jgi:hypothetical protein
VWTAAGSGPAAIGYPGVAATVLANGDVLYAGGLDAGYCAAPTTALFDPRTRSWKPVGNLSTGRAFGSAVLLPDGHVLALGGVSGGPSGCSGAARATRGIQQAGAAPAPAAARLALALLQAGQLEAVGRLAGAASPQGARIQSATSTTLTFAVQSSTEQYDPVTGAWAADAALPAGQVYGAATLLRDGTVLAVGGRADTAAITALLAHYSY